jgi:cytochrome c551/c552
MIMKVQQTLLTLALCAFTLLFTACSGSDGSNGSDKAGSAASKNGLTEFQQENGIGPVTEEVDLGAFNEELAEKGQKLFKAKCSACHKIGERYVGPNLEDVLDRRTPAYVMNMVMNPQEMIQKHPEAKKLLAQFMTPMPYQNVSREETRAIVEYFRKVNTDK